MLVKLLSLCIVITAVHGDNNTIRCPLKGETDLNLDKLSGMWYMDRALNNQAESFKSIVKTMDFKKDGTNYTLTTILYKQGDNNETHITTLMSGLDGNNVTVMFRPEAPSQNIYMLAAEYDKFAVLYVCYNEYITRKMVVDGMRFMNVFVVTRSQKVDEETRKKINSALSVYPELHTLMNSLN